MSDAQFDAALVILALSVLVSGCGADPGPPTTEATTTPSTTAEPETTVVATTSTTSTPTTTQEPPGGSGVLTAEVVPEANATDAVPVENASDEYVREVVRSAANASGTVSVEVPEDDVDWVGTVLNADGRRYVHGNTTVEVELLILQ